MTATATPPIPPLAHELMDAAVPGFGQVIRQAACRIRDAGYDETMPLSPEALLERSELRGYFQALDATWVAGGTNPDDAWADVTLLTAHAHYALAFELHRRKTFWVDESLAFMLALTRLDVRGEGLRLPFPSFALVFTDRETLAIGEALAMRDPDAHIRGQALRSLTVYVTRVAADAGGLGLHLSLLLDANRGGWPWLMTRDLLVRPDADLDAIIESRFPDVEVATLAPLFSAPELRQLVQLIINAILFATSSPSWPVITPPPRAGTAVLSRRGTKKHARAVRQLENQRRRETGEAVWHLPGKIPISQIRALRELRQTTEGGALFSRSMVRGHWRRAPDTWTDPRPRWIEPYWKGPELGAIVEREYRLKP